MMTLTIVAALAAAQADAPHAGDYRTCKPCKGALEKAHARLKGGLEKAIGGYWYAEFLNSFWGGFYFLAEGNSAAEAKRCADKIASYMDPWVKTDMGYTGWFCSMAMLYLTEYSLKYGLTPDIAAKLSYGAKWCHKTREAEGGWFHSPRWGYPNYALDISSIGCAYFAAVVRMKALGLDPGPALDDVKDYVAKVCDGRSVAYGLHGRGGRSWGASAYLVLGLTGAGQASDPLVAGIGSNLRAVYKDLHKGHASGILHHFAVAAALHRLGPDAYAEFAGYYLHDRLIPLQHPDGMVGTFPNDGADYAKMKAGDGDYAATAAFATMILLTRPGALAATPAKKPGTISNKEAFKRGMDALGRKDLGKAWSYLSQVLPGGEAEDLVPQAKEILRTIETRVAERLREPREHESRGKELEAAGDFKAAAEAYESAAKAFEALGREFTGVAIMPDTRALADDLRKSAAAARKKAR